MCINYVLQHVHCVCAYVFSALTLLVGQQQEEHPTCKKLSDMVLVLHCSVVTYLCFLSFARGFILHTSLGITETSADIR